MTKVNNLPSEGERMIAEASQKVETALKGLNLEELMQINLQVSKVEQEYAKAEQAWFNRSTEEQDQPMPKIPPLPEMTVIEGDTRWHERLTSLVGEDKRLDHLTLGTLRIKLHKLARENPVL